MLRRTLINGFRALRPFRSTRWLSGSKFNEKELLKKWLVAEETCRRFNLSDDDLTDVMHRMTKAMDTGLSESTQYLASVKCWNTCIDQMPKNNIAGRFLALDLDSSKLRILLVSLTGQLDKNSKWSSQTYMDKRLKTVPGPELFDHAARRLADFTEKFGVYKDRLPMAFAFGFPTEHTAPDAAKLVRWTKGFNCTDVVGRDVVAMLREAIGRTGMTTDVVAVVNNTSGTLVASAIDEPATRVALVVGDGCNCCYVENVSNVGTYKGTSKTGKTVINTEWGAFGEEAALNSYLTSYDQYLDYQSSHPGTQVFEKMVSGLYMGELVRLMVLDLVQKGAMFNGKSTPQMLLAYGLKARHLAIVVSDRQNSFQGVRNLLESVLGVQNPTDIDCGLFRYICECVTKRSAYLVAAGLASILRRLELVDRTVVAVDGAVFQNYPLYPQLVGQKAKKLTEGRIPFDLRLNRPMSRSEFGAALVAATLFEPHKTLDTS